MTAVPHASSVGKHRPSTAASIRSLRISVPTEAAPVTLVEDVTLAVDVGSVLAIVGETGAGKTLLVRAVLGLLAPSMIVEGEIELGGVVIQDRRAARESLRAGAVLQNPAGMMDPLMRVGEQMIEAVVLHKRMSRAQAFARATTLLEELGFERPSDVLMLYPHQLSGGMAQRAAIAVALMPQPDLLVVDEPTSALDANLRVEILALLRRLAREHDRAVILVSHDLALVSRFSDTVAVMYAGRVLEHGPTAEVLEQPQHPYTQALLAAAPSNASARKTPLATISGTPPPPGRWPSGCVFRSRCPHAFEACDERPRLPEGSTRGAACHLVASEGRS